MCTCECVHVSQCVCMYVCVCVCVCVCGVSVRPSQAFLGKIQHRLLSAAEAAKMAVIYSQYASLYVLTNVVSFSSLTLDYSGGDSIDRPICMHMNWWPAGTDLWSVLTSLTNTLSLTFRSKSKSNLFLKHI